MILVYEKNDPDVALCTLFMVVPNVDQLQEDEAGNLFVPGNTGSIGDSDSLGWLSVPEQNISISPVTAGGFPIVGVKRVLGSLNITQHESDSLPKSQH